MKINFKKKTKLSLSLLVCSSALFLGGTGVLAWDGVEDIKEPEKNSEEVYQIGSAEELAWFAKEVNSGKTIDAVLTKDIDLENKQWTPIGANFGGSSSFSGNFDGKEFTIKGFNIENANGWAGLFGKNDGSIANFSLEGKLDASGGNASGSVVGWNAKTIDNVSSSVELTAKTKQSVGGIAGQTASSSTISNSEFKGKVSSSSSQHTGGIAGKSMSGNLIGNINYGDISGPSGSIQARIGGIVGTVELTDPTVIANNLNYGNIFSDSSNAYIAGIIGHYNNRSSSGSKDKHLFFNSINFGNLVGENAKETDSIINNAERINKDAMYQSKNLFNSTDDKFNLENAVNSINDFNGSEFESPIAIPESAKFNLAKDGSIKLTSQLNRSKEEPVDEEKLKEAQEYVEKAVKALKDSWYKSTPEFGKDTNVNTMLEKALAEKGFKDIKVSLKNTSNEEFVGKDGTVHYYYKNPNESDFMRFRTVSIDYEFQKDGASTIYEKVNTVVHWDRDKLTNITNEEITNKLTLDAIKDKNESTEKFDKDLLLPKHVDGKKWAEVKWYSSDESLVKIDNSLQTGGSSNLSNPYIGKIKRGEKDQKVTLYAEVHNNFIQNGQPELVIEKELEVTIKGLGAESKDEMQALMDEHYTFDKMTDTVTKEKIDPKNIVNDIGLPNPKGTGIPLSHLYKFTAESNTPDVLTVNGYRAAVLRPLPGEPAKKASFTVTMSDRNSSLSTKKTFEVMIQPISQKEIDDEIKLMDAVKANYFNGLNKAGNSDPLNITERLNTFQQASFKEDGKTIDWVYDQKDLKGKGIIPVSIDLAKPSEQWDRFHSSNNTVLQHESFYLTKPKYDTKVTVTSCLSSSIFADYAKAHPENKDLQKIYRQPVSVDLIVKGTDGENPKPDEKRKVTLSIIGDKNHTGNDHSSYTNWLDTTGEGNEYSTAFDIFKKAMNDNGYTFVGDSFISSITSPSGVTLGTKTHGENSGWMYAVNGKLPNVMATDYKIEDGDKIVWFYTDDYATDSRIKNGQFIPETNVETDMQKATRLINAIGEVTLEKEEAIKEARAALNKVKTPNQQFMALNAKLEGIENQLNKLKMEAKEKEEAQKVETLIHAIGKVELASEQAITEAMQAYDQLSENAQKLVTNYVDLENAQKELARLVAEKENQEAADNVIEAINSIKESTMANKALVELTRSKFNALTTEQQKLVTNVAALETAETTILSLTNAVNDVVKAIDGLPEKVTLNNKETVNSIIDKYNTLPDASKEFVTNFAALELAQKQIENLETIKPIEELISAIGKVTLESEKAITESRKAFDELSPELQQIVSNYDVLVKAEVTLKELKDAEVDSSQKELAEYKEKANKELATYKNEKDYREKQKVELTNILKEAKTNIKTATDKTMVDKIVSNTKKELEKVKTDKELTKEETTPQGPCIKDGRFVTIERKGYSTWSNFDWKERNQSNKIIGVTYQSKGKYNHKNGATYLSLYDNKGKWHGYINEKAIKTVDGWQGAHIKDGRFVTISNGNYDTWSNFSWKKRHSSKDLLTMTFEARGQYKHMNGATYLSLYDNKGKWYGYINEKAVKIGDGKQGAYIKDGRFVTISKNNYSIWSNFNWKKRQSSNNVLNQTFQIKGRYHHINGDTYYSLYDNNGKWHGYINANATKIAEGKQGAYISDGRKVTINKKGYSTWSNFSWKKRNTTNKMLGKTFIAKGKYNHINGSTYYSLYDNNGKWHGYVNKNAVR